jgi:23S rRNA pseudouridine2605 synthase
MPDAKSKVDRPNGERLHKYLASSGAGSRRECETFIKQGRVSVNGKVVTRMGVKVVAGEDVVLFDGERMQPERKVYYLLNKPTGYICTNSDERGRPRAVDLLPDRGQRIYTVGRLDADSQGLILLTNDGTIANIICHPRYRVEKIYEIVVRGKMTRYHGTRLEAGVWLAEGKASPARVEHLAYDPRKDETRLQMTLFEGRNREIRRVFAKVGLKVKRLVRTSIGPLELGSLPAGQFVALAPADLRFVYEAERLYQANRELWDAELPPTPKARPRRPRPTGPGRPRVGGRPRQGQDRQGGRGGSGRYAGSGRRGGGGGQGRPRSTRRPERGRGPREGGGERGSARRGGASSESSPRRTGSGGPARRRRRFYP